MKPYEMRLRLHTLRARRARGTARLDAQIAALEQRLGLPAAAVVEAAPATVETPAPKRRGGKQR